MVAAVLLRAAHTSVLFCCLCAAQLAFGAELRPIPTSDVRETTVPLAVEGNRPFVDVTLRLSDGTERTGRFVVDSGGGAFLIAEKLARSLNLQFAKAGSEEGIDYGKPSEVPTARIGAHQLTLDRDRVLVVMNRDSILPPSLEQRGDGLLPGHVLQQYHVVLDYPARLFTLAERGLLTPKGSAMPMPVHRKSGFPRTEIEVGGRKVGVLLDTGAAFSMVSEALLRELASANPGWPRYAGAHGEAKLLGSQTLETLLIPRGTWGEFEIGAFGVTSQRKGVFEDWMSSMTVQRVSGALAGNVLRVFRVELDYPNQTLYLSREPEAERR